MSDCSGKLDKYMARDSYCQFRTDCCEFPWYSTGRGVWYALLTVENGRINRYGFSSSKSSKKALCEALKSLTSEDVVQLLGVWTGNYTTDLFVLEKSLALEYLEGDKRFYRFEKKRKIKNVVKVCGPRGGFRYIEYSYSGESGVSSYEAIHDRSEAEDFEEYCNNKGITIKQK